MAKDIWHARLSEKQDRRKKLTNKEYEEIKDKYFRDRRTQQSIADEYGVSQSTICYIVNPISAKKV